MFFFTSAGFERKEKKREKERKERKKERTNFFPQGEFVFPMQIYVRMMVPDVRTYGTTGEQK